MRSLQSVSWFTVMRQEHILIKKYKRKEIEYMYTTPEIELIAIDVEDILTNSNDAEDNKTPDDEL